MIKQASFFSKNAHRVLELYQKSFWQAFRSPALWVSVGLYALAGTYLVIVGHSYLLLVALYALLTLLGTLLIVIPLTVNGPLPHWQEQRSYPRWILWCQLGILGLYLFWVYFLSYYFVKPFLPFMSPVEERLYLLLIQVIIPVSGALLLRARWNEVGLGRGFKSWSVAGALLVIPVILIIIGIATGKQTLLSLPAIVLYLFLSAGLPEEIGFRGILMTRLIRLFDVQWGIVISSLMFCIIHFQINQFFFHVGLLDSLAICILFNMVVGIAFAIITQRTSNLLASITFHIFSDVLSFALLPLFLSTFK